MVKPNGTGSTDQERLTLRSGNNQRTVKSVQRKQRNITQASYATNKNGGKGQWQREQNPKNN